MDQQQVDMVRLIFETALTNGLIDDIDTESIDSILSVLQRNIDSELFDGIETVINMRIADALECGFRAGWKPASRPVGSCAGSCSSSNGAGHCGRRRRIIFHNGGYTMNCPRIERVVGRKRYDTETATLLAHDVYWDGRNFERHGRNQWLFRTTRGAYFVVTASQWQGEVDSLQPIGLHEAIELYEGPLSEHAVDYDEAFPGVDVVDA